MEHQTATITAEGPPTDIIEARTEQEVAAVARLLREFACWCQDRYANRAWQVARYFEANAWEAELADLGARYAPPEGALFLARHGDRGAGCVAVHLVGGGVAELRYLYVRPHCRGLGLGRRLTQAAVAWAAAHRCRAIRLDTGDLQPEAQELYRSIGFREIPPYYQLPPDLRAHLVFMEKAL